MQAVLHPFEYPALDPPYQWFHGFNLYWSPGRRVALKPAKSPRHARERFCPGHLAAWPAEALQATEIVIGADGAPWLVGPGYRPCTASQLMDLFDMDHILGALAVASSRYASLVQMVAAKERTV